MTITELDAIRCDQMHYWLDEQGCGYIWQYDVIRRKQALREAIYNYDYDNMEIDRDATKEYALVGPGICDCLFNTVDELKAVVKWLCTSYLGCYLNKERSV